MNLKVFYITVTVIIIGAAGTYLVIDRFYSDVEVGVLDPRFIVKNSQAAFLAPVFETNYLPIRDWSILEPDIKAKASAVYDTLSGKMLFQKNLRTQLPVASITKLLTAMVVVDNINPRAIITVTKEAMNVDEEGGPDFYLDERFYSENLLLTLLVESSNDAALAYQYHMNNNGQNIVELINTKALDIGMINSNFKDPAGLDDDGYSTAEDIIMLMIASMKYDEINDALVTKSVKISSVDGQFEHELLATNQLLNAIGDIKSGKTGYTDGSLGSIVLAVGNSDTGSDVVAVVLGSFERFNEMNKLVDWTLRSHSWR